MTNKKEFNKEVYIRNLTEEDNNMLNNLRETTEKTFNTKALLFAGYKHLQLTQENESLNELVNLQSRELDSLKNALKQIRYYQNIVDEMLLADTLTEIADNE